MKISQKFKLGRTQHELDFVDINIRSDTPLFVDPYLISKLNSPWAVDATRTIRSFFATFLKHISNGDYDRAKEIFLHLREPNETRLGLSTKKPKGRGVGRKDAERIFKSMLQSQAVKTGLLKDIEDCRLFVNGIDRDKTSDMTSNIIRSHLAKYTVSQCNLWGIPTQKDIPIGEVWDRKLRKWDSVRTDALIVEGKQILLVPKHIVVFKSGYTARKYYDHFILNFLQAEHLRLDTTLVHKRRLKSGAIKCDVYKKDLKAHKDSKYSKDFLATFSQDHKEVLKKFKETNIVETSAHVNAQISKFSPEQIAKRLKQELLSIPAGSKNATRYHQTIIGILEFIFFPTLNAPQIEQEIHEGRKRIDATFDNCADRGFFHTLCNIHQTPCPYILIECKNYSSDLANPELDQLSGRFSPNRGKFGLLLCRNIDNMTKFLKRCNDTYKDQRGTIIPIVDEDIILILDQIADGQCDLDKRPEEKLLQDRLRVVALS